MKTRWLVGCAFAVVVLGCSGANDKGSGGEDAGADDSASADETGDGGVVTSPTDKLTWAYVYKTYFGKGTAGHCGEAGCHGTARSGFVCASQAGCYASITAINTNVGGKMVDPNSPAQSVLLDVNNSPLFWFNQASGNMPNGALVSNPSAAADITAWIEVGAPDN